jgi:MFS superfamily sulfate permease-like transporter
MRAIISFLNDHRQVYIIPTIIIAVIIIILKFRLYNQIDFIQNKTANKFDFFFVVVIFIVKEKIKT